MTRCTVRQSPVNAHGVGEATKKLGHQPDLLAFRIPDGKGECIFSGGEISTSLRPKRRNVLDGLRLSGFASVVSWDRSN
jgi:hypothetical protein